MCLENSGPRKSFKVTEGIAAPGFRIHGQGVVIIKNPRNRIVEPTNKDFSIKPIIALF